MLRFSGVLVASSFMVRWIFRPYVSTAPKVVGAGNAGSAAIAIDNPAMLNINANNHRHSIAVSPS